jgi:all-trans-retinol 13,14-reductase
MEKYDVIIIGSGLGGLECGFILAKNGMKVCILEQHKHLGGCLQTYHRKGLPFDTGFHYVGGLGEGQALNRLFRYFGLLDLPWHPLDEEAFDEIVIGGKSYFFANGHERFVDTLSQSFPHQRTNLTRYASFLKQVGDRLFDSFTLDDKSGMYTTSLFTRSAYDFLNETIDDPLLRKVLSGASLKMELNAGKLPLYVFAQINNSFIRSAWRLRGGGSLIVDRLAQQIEAMGGEVRTRAAVTRLTEANGLLSTVEVNGDEQLSAKWIISDVHPAYTLSLIDETKLIRNIYRKRISSIPNTFGLFTASLQLKPDRIPYRNRNLFVHSETADLWHPDPDAPLSSVLSSFQIPEDGSLCTRNIDLLTPMYWSEVKKWKDEPRKHRGDDYMALKTARAEACIDFVSKQIPGLRDAIDEVYTSTPLTYTSYTNTVEGAAYGIQKDCTQPMFTVLTPRTPVPNLLLTGQNLNLHGILGVSVTSLFTCAEIVGKDRLKDSIIL